MSGGYESHADFMRPITERATKRQRDIETALRTAFAPFIELREVETIVFAKASIPDLASAIEASPSVLKPLLAACNLAARAVERDLQIANLDTYNPRLSAAQVNGLAGYLKAFLPDYIEVPALSHIDRIEYTDKEIRKAKGRWERAVLASANRYGPCSFKKRKFMSGGESFEIDAAGPKTGPITIAIDVKRIEARRDIHKRCDEIVNKAARLKNAVPQARFAAFIYYPFVDEHTNVKSRLHSGGVDVVMFASASEESVDNAVRFLFTQLGTT